MVWSIFKQRENAAAPSIADAIARLNAEPTAHNRSIFYSTLKTGHLFLATGTIPQSWAQGPVTLQSATTVSVLTSSAPDGGEALLAFTSHAEALRRDPSVSTFTMESLDVLRLVLEEKLSGLILNPAGPWAGIPVADVHAILGAPRGGL